MAIPGVLTAKPAPPQRRKTRSFRRYRPDRRAFGIKITGRIVGFEHYVLDAQRRLKVSVLRFVARSDLVSIVTAHTGSRGSGAATTSCSIAHLAYLNRIEALNCAFCSYANGLVGFVRDVSSRTEQYWCPIEHALRVDDPLHRYYAFFEYGDADGYRSRLAEFRDRQR